MKDNLSEVSMAKRCRKAIKEFQIQGAEPHQDVVVNVYEEDFLLLLAFFGIQDPEDLRQHPEFGDIGIHANVRVNENDSYELASIVKTYRLYNVPMGFIE